MCGGIGVFDHKTLGVRSGGLSISLLRLGWASRSSLPSDMLTLLVEVTNVERRYWWLEDSRTWIIALQPLSHKAYRLFVSQFIPEAIGSHDQEIALLGEYLSGGDDGFGCQIWRCFESRARTSSEKSLLGCFLNIPRPLK